MTKFVLNQSIINRVLIVVDAGLCSGIGKPVPGNMCVEAAVCYALGLPHGDDPKCVDQAIRSMKIKLNDASWSCNEARAKGLRRLAVLQLGTKDCGFDSVDFSKRLTLSVINNILPDFLRRMNLKDHATACETAYNLATAAYAAANATNAAANATNAAAYATRLAAAYAAANATNATRLAAAYAAANATRLAAANATYAAANATNAAAYAAYAAANAATRDEILLKFAKIAEDILIDMNVPAVKFLDLIK